MKKYVKFTFLLLFVPFISCKKNLDINCIQGPAVTNCTCTPAESYVCGCNNQTYTNSCLAECDGITFYTLGKCP